MSLTIMRNAYGVICAKHECAINHLNNPTTHKKISRMPAKTIENKINNTWKDICQRKNIPRRVERSYKSTNTDLPRFYHLIKTHKLQQGIHIRPIVSNTNGPTSRLSWLMSHLLKPLLADIPAHLENSLELMNNIQTTDHTILLDFTVTITEEGKSEFEFYRKKAKKPMFIR